MKPKNAPVTKVTGKRFTKRKTTTFNMNNDEHYNQSIEMVGKLSGSFLDDMKKWNDLALEILDSSHLLDKPEPVPPPEPLEAERDERQSTILQNILRKRKESPTPPYSQHGRAILVPPDVANAMMNIRNKKNKKGEPEYSHDSKEGLAAKIIEEYWLMTDEHNAIEKRLAAAFQLGCRTTEIKVYCITNISAKNAQEVAHGDESEKNERWDDLQNELEQTMDDNPKLGVTRARELTVKRLKKENSNWIVSKSTMKRRTKDPRKK